MDSDDGLMLNIVESKNDEFGASIPDKRSKIKWKERRQQRRRNNTLFKEKLNLDRREKSFDNNNEWKSSNDLKLKNEESNIIKETPKPTGKPQVISSLFRHNPEIPKVKSSNESKDACTKKECQTDKPLFSGEKFSELPLSPHMVSNLEKNLQMTTLTSIQRSAIPALIEGKDVFVKSKTGSGKTLCYALPIVHTLQEIRPKTERCNGPYALVLVPTRELALQSLSLLQKLVKPFQWIVPGFVVGGENRKAEKARLRKGINILVATPGRLLDHIEKTTCLDFRKIRWIILDEADRLLDLGFEKDVSTILQSVKDKIPSAARCQTVLMSATLNKGVEKLVQMFLTDPQFVDESGTQDATNKHTNEPRKAVREDSTQKTPQQLKQFFVIVPSKMRLVALATFLISKHNVSHSCKSIVFLSSRDSVDFHHTLFKSVLCEAEGKKFKLFKLHGNMSQAERTEVFNEYSSCTGGVLLCTDVAARGLDLPNVNWIVQYNTPGSAVDYIHRVGRTARIGTEGQALIFLTPSEAEYLDTLAEHSIRPKEVLVSDVLRTLLPAEKPKVDKRGRKDSIDHQAQETATILQMKFEEFVLSNTENIKSAKKAYQSFVRSYATFPANLKHIFHVKNLHLGHVAKAFALRDAPTGMFGQGKDKRKKEKTRKESRDKQTLKKKRGIPVDEHMAEDALSGPRPKKRKKIQR